MTQANPNLLAHFKHNTNLYTLDQLESLVVQREPLAQSLLANIVSSINSSERHHNLILGPRGSGKTFLVSLVAQRLAAREDLKNTLLIARIPEDAWNVTSYSYLLGAILQALAATPSASLLQESIKALDKIKTAEEFETAAQNLLAQTIADKALLLIIENLDSVFKNFNLEDQTKLHTLLTAPGAPRIITLAASQSLLEEEADNNNTFKDFFHPIHLSPFTFHDAVQLLTKLALKADNKPLADLLQTPLGKARIRALHLLAAGNPRVYVTFSQFLTFDNLISLIQPLLQTLDDLTPYYQARMMFLSPQQRNIINHLIDIRGAASVKEIAESLRISQQTTSGQLRKLDLMGYVHTQPAGMTSLPAPNERRETWYELREPLLRLCLEAKKNHAQPLRLLIDLLRLWFAPSELESYAHTLPPDATDTRELIQQTLIAARSNTKGNFLASIESGILESRLNFDYKSAIEAAEALVALDCTAESLAELADAYFWAKDYGKADQIIQEALQLNANSAHALVIEIHKLLREKSFTAVINQSTALCNRNDLQSKHKARALFLRAFARDETKDFLGAADDLAQVIAMPDAPNHILLWAIINIGVVFGTLGRHQDEIKAYDSLISHFSHHSHLATLEQIAIAMTNKGIALGRHEQYLDAIKTLDAVIEHFSQHSHPAILEKVAISMISKGITFGQSKHYQEEIKMYDIAIERFLRYTEPRILEQIATAMVNKGCALGQLERYQEEIEAYDAVIAHFRQNTNPAILEKVAVAMVNKGVTLGQLDRHQEEIKTYDATIERFAEYTHPEIIKQVAMAMLNKGITLVQLNRHQEGIKTYDTVIEHFSHHTQSEILEQVVAAIINKGAILGQLNRHQEEIKTYDTVIDRFTQSSHPEILTYVAMTMFNKSKALRKTGHSQSAILACDILINRLSQSSNKDEKNWHSYAKTYRASILPIWDSLHAAISALLTPAIQSTAIPHINEALATLPSKINNDDLSDYAADFSPLLNNLLTHSHNNPAQRRAAISTIVTTFSAANQLPLLGATLLRTIQTLRDPSFLGLAPDLTRKAWLTAWQECAQDQPQLSLSVRLLQAAIGVLVERDTKPMLKLAAEERSLIEPLLLGYLETPLLSKNEKK